MTIESPQDPPRTPDGEPGLPRGEMPGTGSVMVILGIVLAAILAFVEFS